MKKIIPAFCMLLVSALLMGTSTFAWFSMNKTVTATGMSVTAKSNAKYLLIDTADNATSKDTSDTSKTALNATKTVYPAAFEATTGTAHAGYTTVKNNEFYTASNGNTDNATDDMKNGQTVTEGSEDYMLTNTFYLSLSEDSEDYSGDLDVTFKLNSGDVAISAVVKIGETYIALNSTSTTGTATVSLTSSTSVTVVVYTYVDGNSENVYSDYDGTITGAIELTFTID